MISDYVAEKYNFPSPPKSTIKENSHMWNYIQKSKNRFPLLYGNDKFSHLRVIENIFCTIGCVDVFKNKKMVYFMLLMKMFSLEKALWIY